MSRIAEEIDSTGTARVEMRNGSANFIDEELLRELADAMEVLEHNDAVRTIVLRSAGKHFSGGAKLTGMSEADVRRVYQQGLRLFAGSKPIIAVVNGSAVGGGLGLALAADFRIAGPEARFTSNFSRIGFHHGFGLSATLPHLVGRQFACEMLYTGRDVHAREALEAGLCDRLSDEPLAEALRFAEQINCAAPLSVRAIRRNMRRSLMAEVSQAMDIEASAQGELLPTADLAEGIAASIAKRAPQFIGR